MKTELTDTLEKSIWRQTQKIGTFGCFEVTIGIGGKERVDYMTIDTKGTVRCYEIKISKSDFFSKSKTSFVGNYNYYVLTPELYEKVKVDIPKGIGVYVGENCVRSPKKKEFSELPYTFDVLSSSMIRSLSREVQKYERLKQVDAVAETVTLRKIIAGKDKTISALSKELFEFSTFFRLLFGKNSEKLLEEGTRKLFLRGWSKLNKLDYEDLKEILFKQREN